MLVSDRCCGAKMELETYLHRGTDVLRGRGYGKYLRWGCGALLRHGKEDKSRRKGTESERVRVGQTKDNRTEGCHRANLPSS